MIELIDKRDRIGPVGAKRDRQYLGAVGHSHQFVRSIDRPSHRIAVRFQTTRQTGKAAPGPGHFFIGTRGHQRRQIAALRRHIRVICNTTSIIIVRRVIQNAAQKRILSHKYSLIRAAVRGYVILDCDRNRPGKRGWIALGVGYNNKIS